MIEVDRTDRSTRRRIGKSERALAHHPGQDALSPARQGLRRRRATGGETKTGIMWCLKRYIARETFALLTG